MPDLPWNLSQLFIYYMRCSFWQSALTEINAIRRSFRITVNIHVVEQICPVLYIDKPYTVLKWNVRSSKIRVYNGTCMW
jgi:hypothetical protein